MSGEDSSKGQAAQNGDDSATHPTPKAPSLAKFYSVAVGWEEWTPEEQAWIDQDPARLERHKKLCEIVEANRKDRAGGAPSFRERLDEESRRKSQDEGRGV